jgi:membrane-bound serine protease (ClpP class)
MEIFFTANFAYILLLTGMLLGLLAMVTPGTGLLEVGALFVLAAAGYVAFNLGPEAFNAWALIPLGLGLVPFLAALRYKHQRGPLLASAILLAITGSIFLFKSPEGSLVGVNPLLAVVVSVLYSGSLWIMVERSLAAMLQPVAHNLDVVIGQIGEARTRIKENGSVQVGGELWSAHSETAIPAGSAVRVLARDGFSLLVEKESHSPN